MQKIENLKKNHVNVTQHTQNYILKKKKLKYYILCRIIISNQSIDANHKKYLTFLS